MPSIFEVMNGVDGPGIALIVNPEKAFETRAPVVTVMVRNVAAAVGSIEITIGILVLLPPGEIVAVIPVPLKMTALTPLKLKPVKVAETVVPCSPDPGAEMPVTIGEPAAEPTGPTVRTRWLPSAR